jgi:hypothetical protein
MDMHDTNVLSVADLDATSGELLPSRETLALVNIANITAINIAIAINAGGHGTSATAMAQQIIAVAQS